MRRPRYVTSPHSADHSDLGRERDGACRSSVSLSFRIVQYSLGLADNIVNLEDIPGGRKAGSAEWGGIGNLFWLADPTSEVAMIIFNSALPYGSESFVGSGDSDSDKCLQDRSARLFQALRRPAERGVFRRSSCPAGLDGVRCIGVPSRMHWFSALLRGQPVSEQRLATAAVCTSMECPRGYYALWFLQRVVQILTHIHDLDVVRVPRTMQWPQTRTYPRPSRLWNAKADINFQHRFLVIARITSHYSSPFITRRCPNVTCPAGPVRSMARFPR